ncbi:MAG: GNAT family N-acetyltransferase [Candidatus Thiodiazotropha lotti]
MVNPIEIFTDRLLLRQWRSTDLEPFAQLNADPEVMTYFPAILSRKQSDDLAQRCQQLIQQRGWGFWAVEHKSSCAFIGFLGLHIPRADLPFFPVSKSVGDWPNPTGVMAMPQRGAGPLCRWLSIN